MKVKLAFQKNCDSFWGKLVKWWTKSNYCHVEILLPLTVRGKVEKTGGLWFSANNIKGIRIKPIVYPLNTQDWDYIEVTLPTKSKKEYQELMKYINEVSKYKYAYLDIFLVHVLGLKDMDVRKQMFCSEAVANILLKAKEKKITKAGKSAVSYTPEDLFQLYKVDEQKNIKEKDKK